MDQWQAALPNLKAERVLIEAEQKEIVNRFKLRRYGRMFIDCLRIEAHENKIESEKN